MDVQGATAVGLTMVSSQSIVFRSDASLDIGTGHVMRCLTLAEGLRRRHATCRFLCRDHPGNLVELIRQRGFEVCTLPTDSAAIGIRSTSLDFSLRHSSWLGTDRETDLRQTLHVLGGETVDWLVVDHYALDGRWESAARVKCRRVMVLDDLADRSHDCDLLLDQNFGRNETDYAGLVPASCALRIGPHFALLRSEFSKQRARSLARRAFPQLQHLLITMGGVDRGNATCKVLEALSGSELARDCRITIVMGPHAPWLDAVRHLAAQSLWKCDVVVNTRNMANLMRESDLAIGAAGSTAWERCALGLPTVMFVLADNQRAVAQHLSAAGAATLLDIDLSLGSRLPQLLQQFSDDPSALRAMSDRAAGICSGSGTDLIVGHLLASKH